MCRPMNPFEGVVSGACFWAVISVCLALNLSQGTNEEMKVVILVTESFLSHGTCFLRLVPVCSDSCGVHMARAALRACMA